MYALTLSPFLKASLGINSSLLIIASLFPKSKIMSYIEIANKEGVLLLGKKNLENKVADGDNCFVWPTIIDNISLESEVCRDEIFGPVVAIHSFKNENSLLEDINNSKYGLASVIWTSNISRAHSFAEKINCGIVWINCWMVRDLRTPFGGNKDSGFGREGGEEVMNFYTESKNVCIDYNEK